MRYIGSDAVFYPLPLQKCRFLKGIASNNTKPEAMRFEGGGESEWKEAQRFNDGNNVE